MKDGLGVAIGQALRRLFRRAHEDPVVPGVGDAQLPCASQLGEVGLGLALAAAHEGKDGHNRGHAQDDAYGGDHSPGAGRRHGTDPGVPGGYDQLVVNGTVTLAGALDVGGSYSTTPNDLFWIILNDGDDKILGQFDGIDPGQAITIDSRNFYVYYEADYDTGLLSGGNDVLLTSVPEPSTFAMLLGLAGVGLLGWVKRRRGG